MSDYTDAGFDNFLSRSIDNAPQATLDSNGPASTQMRYDSAQISGAIGDSFKMGGIGMNAKSSSITTNNGSFIVNNTTDSNTITLEDGVETFQDSDGTIFRIGALSSSVMGADITDRTGFLLFQQDGQTWMWKDKITGTIVAKLGKQSDGTYNLKFFDANNVGLAQFGKFPDGNTYLKIAKSGIEVSTASNDQLIFNSSQNIFKIVTTAITGTISGVDNSASALWTQNEATIAHGLSYTPAIVGFVTGSSSYLPTRRRPMPAAVNFTSASAFPWAEYVEAYVDSTNVYVRYYVSGNNNASGRSASYTIYLLQETAT